MRATILKAPAKINLFLKVVGRRPDRYHLIESLIVPIGLFDTVSLSPTKEGIDVQCPGFESLCGTGNLAHRAAAFFFEKAGCSGGVNILIKKRIPIEAGLGGGSSDAAATLQGLQCLFQNPLSSAALSEIGLHLGADVPFFLQAGACWATGIGEKLQPIDYLPNFWIVLAQAPFGLSTQTVYQRLNYSLTSAPSSDKKFVPVSAWNFENLALVLHNDLQEVSETLHPEIAKVCQALGEVGAKGALMSGSGPSVFGLFHSRKSAQDALSKLRKERGWNYLVVRGITSRTCATE